MCMVCILTVQAGTDVMHVLWNRRLRCCTLCYQLYTSTPSTMTDLSLITCTSVPSTRSQTEQISRISSHYYWKPARILITGFWEAWPCFVTSSKLHPLFYFADNECMCSIWFAALEWDLKIYAVLRLRRNWYLMILTITFYHIADYCR